ncbi:VWA domain-containing protein [Cytobacillus purgationiresistens]|uniref:VWFA domain-containing protein n=1 Tax=Cytobacillus purgationiresistens TaxID=863449 RepID=A0ABU0AHB2_9BACI|nr:VWA domain-containing protein [Cytobacillus purgationiresistens]MDQ0270259.1 putative membrane protein/putative protein YegL [Cytobacillus purgationiresistens]
MGIEFKYPLLLLLLLPAFFVVFLYLKNGNSFKKGEARIISAIRITVFTLLILALSIPQLYLPIKGERVVFLVDRSASVTGTEAESLAWIEESVKHKGAKDEFAIASFAENIVLDQNLGNQSESLTEFNGAINETETNMESGLQFASSLIPQNSSGRIVAFTDGNETIGNSTEAAKLLKNRGIELDYVQVNSKVGEDMALSDLKVSPSLYEGEEASVSLSVNSNINQTAQIRLFLNNKEILQQKIDVKEGKNEYAFSYEALGSGLQVLKAEIESEGDTFIENNALQAITNIKGKPKVLIVQSDESDHLQKALQSSDLEMNTVMPEKMPTNLSGYLQYQSIIFNNVQATGITEKQMELIEQAVREFGVGFMMAGGEESFGLGGYFKTPIEKLLPVEMEIKGKEEMPSLGLMIVLDRSGSMDGQKLELAKEAAARSVELLREEDTLGFIAFDDRPWVIVETGPLKDKEDAVEKILSVTPGGGTEIFTSLEKAYSELEDLKLQRKHIILLTDGQSSGGGDYDAIIENGKEKNITLSTVAIGQDADRALLEDLAEQGSGRYYDVTDASVIPSILSRETVMATRTYIEDNPFYPLVQNDPEWSSLFKDGIPQMNAYIAVTAKPRAKIPLLSEKEDPILAQWQYGIGRTIAFTSDFSGKWSGDWARWNKWSDFINQLVTATLPQYDSEPFRVSVSKGSEQTTVNLESLTNQSLPIETTVLTEDGGEVKTNAKLVAPGKYEVMVPEKEGMYFLSIKQANEHGEMINYQTGFAIPYSDEYLLEGTNHDLLGELASITTGKKLDKEADAFRPLQQKAFSQQDFSIVLVAFAFLLYFVEIAIRRFGLPSFLRKRQQAYATEESNGVNAHKVIQTNPSAQYKTTESNIKVVKEKTANKKKAVKKQKIRENPITDEEREERMRRLLEAKKRRS